ncbi:hypothetical protein J3E69DRAFT_337423 [Trichoderma sp. SZMC 28015]
MLGNNVRFNLTLVSFVVHTLSCVQSITMIFPNVSGHTGCFLHQTFDSKVSRKLFHNGRGTQCSFTCLTTFESM